MCVCNLFYTMMLYSAVINMGLKGRITLKVGNEVSQKCYMGNKGYPFAKIIYMT